MSALVRAIQIVEPSSWNATRGILMEPPSITKQLYEKAKSGDQAAYEALFGSCTDRLLMFIRLRIGNLRQRIEPEDVLQDTYLAAHRGFADFQYDSEGAFLRWLCRIVDNRIRDAVDYFAAAKRQPIMIPRSTQTGPFTALKRWEQQQRIELAIRGLSEEHQQVLLLRYFQGLSAEESGRIMQRSATAIRSLTSRALTQLGKQLGTVDSQSS